MRIIKKGRWKIRSFNYLPFVFIKFVVINRIMLGNTYVSLPNKMELANTTLYRTLTTDAVVLIVVPGTGDLRRLPALKKSLNNLVRGQGSRHVTCGCHVFVWNESTVMKIREVLDFCLVTYHAGYWTHHMRAIKSNPTVMGQNVTHVALLIDDIDASNVQLRRVVRIMRIAKYGMASAAFPQWHYSAMHQREECSSHRSDYADVLFSTFTISTWRCWSEMLHSFTENKYGWGYDVLLADRCNVRVGIIDEQVGWHEGACINDGDCARSYPEDVAMKQLWKFIQDTTPASNEAEAREHHKIVTSERPFTLPYCDFWKKDFVEKLKGHLKFTRVPDQNIQLETQNEAWKTVIQYLIEKGSIIPTHMMRSPIGRVENRTFTKVTLIDMSEKHFFSGKGHLKRPWMGVLHFAINLPPHLEHELKPEMVLIDKTFLDSLHHCFALVVFTDEIRVKLSKVLSDRGVNNLNFCTIRHPVIIDSSEDEFMLKDLENILHTNTAVLLIGEQYRRISIIHHLAMAREKLWLQRTPLVDNNEMFDKEGLQSEFKFDAVAEADPSVTRINVSDIKEFVRSLKQNIVIIDQWGISVNSAILAVIALNIPAFVRMSPSAVEYLGSSYPMYFSHVSEVEESLNKTSIVLTKMLWTTHVFLRDMNKTYYTMESSGKSLEKCVYSGFKMLPKHMLDP